MSGIYISLNENGLQHRYPFRVGYVDDGPQYRSLHTENVIVHQDSHNTEFELGDMVTLKFKPGGLDRWLRDLGDARAAVVCPSPGPGEYPAGFEGV